MLNLLCGYVQNCLRQMQKAWNYSGDEVLDNIYEFQHRSFEQLVYSLKVFLPWSYKKISNKTTNLFQDSIQYLKYLISTCLVLPCNFFSYVTIYIYMQASLQYQYLIYNLNLNTCCHLSP
jgi:hypothetical protein